MFDSSGGDNRSRLEEARKLIALIVPHLHQLPQKEREFIVQTEYRLESFGDSALVTPKQLFWMRDIRDRIL